MSNVSAFRSMGRLAAVVGSLGLLTLGGCATAIRGTTQKVSVVTEPPGAECLVGNEMMDAPVRIAATPGEAEVRRDGRPLQLSCRRTGYVVHDERVEAVSAPEVDDVAQRRAMIGSGVLVGTASVGIPTVAVTALTVSAQSARAVELVGYAVLPADTFAPGPPSGAYSSSGERGAPRFPSQPVQGFSAIRPLGGGAFLVLSDNGFGSKRNSPEPWAGFVGAMIWHGTRKGRLLEVTPANSAS